MFLNKKQLTIAIPCFITLGMIAYLGPIHNLMLPPNVLSDDQLKIYDNKNNDTIVVYPIFTEYAYSKHGFYEYYKKTCGIECLNVTISRNGSDYEKLVTNIGSTYWVHPQEETSKTAFIILTKLNYHWITDIDIDKNPKILDRYNKIILLHNEYVSKSEYQAISKKNNVIYLYPNALYAEVKPNYVSNTMILLKGHGYLGINNAFNSGTHSQGEYQLHCKDPFWYKLSNGMEYSCYPELDLLNDRNLLDKLKNH